MPAERREGALCVAVQALFELGRAEEAFDHILRHYPSGTQSEGSANYSCVPPDLLVLLCRLRLHLDGGDATSGEKMMAQWLVRVCDTTSQEAALRGAT